MDRLEAVKLLMRHLHNELVVANLGSNSADLYAAGDRPENLYLRGSMGLTAAVGLGLALAQPKHRVIVLDGDGSLLMNMGTLSTIADQAPSNLVHIVFDNEAWALTGHQPTHTARVTDLAAVARGAGVRRVALVRTLEDFQRELASALQGEGPWCIVAKVEERGQAGPMPPITASANTVRFMEALR